LGGTRPHGTNPGPLVKKHMGVKRRELSFFPTEFEEPSIEILQKPSALQ
jgi:hypothetical protein